MSSCPLGLGTRRIPRTSSRTGSPHARRARLGRTSGYIDGSALETWLEQRPAVAALHARRTLGVKPQEGVRSTDEYWQDFAGQFNPMLTEEVLLCEREDAAQQLIQGLLQPSNIVSLVADLPDEVVAFAIAAIRKAAEDVRHFLEARTLVVDSTAAGRQLLANDNLVLLLRDDAARSPAQFSTVGAILVPHGRAQKPDRAATLARPSGFGLGRAMISMGLEETRALSLARGSGRSLTALARLIPGGSFENPAWMNKGLDLIPAILAGAWDASNSLDRAIVEQIAGGTVLLADRTDCAGIFQRRRSAVRPRRDDLESPRADGRLRARGSIHRRTGRRVVAGGDAESLRSTRIRI